MEGQINYYVLNFYLADDTIEIKEKVVQNNGKDPYPLLLKRGKVNFKYFKFLILFIKIKYFILNFSYQNNLFILITQEWP